MKNAAGEWKKNSNDGQKDQEPSEKKEQCLEKEAVQDLHSPGSSCWGKIRVSPTPGLGRIYCPAPGKAGNDGFGALLGKQPRSRRGWRCVGGWMRLLITGRVLSPAEF